MANTITGTSNNDSLDGTAGQDEVFGLDGNDTLFGIEDADTLFGGQGFDTLYGGDGADTLSDRLHTDESGLLGAVMNGGLGDDSYLVGADATTDRGDFRIEEEVSEGTDTIVFENWASTDVLVNNFGDDFRFYFYNEDSALQSIVWITAGRVNVDDGGFYNTNGADFFHRYERIEFSDGVVWDNTTGLFLEASVSGSNLTGTAVGDTFVGKEGNDTFRGAGGDDEFRGGLGEDGILGGAGDDTYFMSAGDGGTSWSGGELIGELAGEGYDTIDFEDVASNAVKAHFDSASQRFALEFSDGAGGVNYLAVRDVDLDNLFSIIEEFNFSDGQTWKAGTGFDAINFVTGGVVAVRTGGQDVLTGTALGDQLGGGGNQDTLSGQGGNDLLSGSGGRDALFGGNGSDDLYGGNGKDVLKAGNGDDQLYGGGNRDKLNGGRGADDLYGGTGNDMLRGGSENDSIYGGTGKDKIFGGAGDDRLYSDSDSFYDAGDDIFNGGAGNDTIFVGFGADKIVFRDGDGADGIFFFDVTNDVIDLRGVAEFDTFADVVTASQQEEYWVEIALNAGDSLRLYSLSTGDLSEDNFLF